MADYSKATLWMTCLQLPGPICVKMAWLLIPIDAVETKMLGLWSH